MAINISRNNSDCTKVEAKLSARTFGLCGEALVTAYNPAHRRAYIVPRNSFRHLFST
jgi:hypothetical protein